MAAPATPRSSKSSTATSKSQTATQTVPQPPQQPAADILPAAHAISTLSSPLALAVNHTHTLVLPALFAARFGAIVADPVAGLAQLLPPVALAQLAYCVLCLSPSVAEPAAAPADEKDKGAVKRRAPSKKDANNTKLAARIVPALLSLILAILSIPLLFALCVLHGAPLTTHLLHTALLAAHLSLLATPPLFYTHGVSSLAWRQVVSLAAPLDSVRAAALGGCLGAWLGAIPIPLDWDRAWQRWPCTVVAGVYAGWMLGKLAGGTVLYGRIINFE